MRAFDRLALVVALLFLPFFLAARLNLEPPLSGFVHFSSYVVLSSYVLYRLVSWVRQRFLWSLRNRLALAYFFIAVVPVFLLVLIGGLAALILFRQLGAYVLYTDIDRQRQRLENTAEVLALSLSDAGGVTLPGAAARTAPGLPRLLERARSDFPGLEWNPELAKLVLARQPQATHRRFSGVVQRGDKVWLLAAAQSGSQPDGMVGLSVPLDEEFLKKLVPDLGPVLLQITRPVRPEDPETEILAFGDLRFVRLRELSTPARPLPAPAAWYDYTVIGVCSLEVTPLDPEVTGTRHALLISLASRPSLLTRRVFEVPGEARSVFLQGLLIVAIVFLVLEVAALITGLNLSRSITRAVDELSVATQHVQAGDFSYRVRVPQRDQLGMLGESFNTMTSSISALIEEQRQRQLLEHEISIAREVQAQLFPKAFPDIPGVQLGALCRAARKVSGDYYDFIQLGPTKLALLIADISGKGISAALLMASLQAAVRSQLLLDPALAENTAELVTRLNRHLFLNTSDDRYATLFLAVYDVTTRQFRYTNAGHLPPFFVSDGQIRRLETGGLVVGLFDEFPYEQEILQVEPQSLLVAYSDGLTEPENVYGEQFGMRRLAEEVMRHRHAEPQRIAELLVSAAEEWASTPEQADDMTVLVARL